MLGTLGAGAAGIAGGAAYALRPSYDQAVRALWRPVEPKSRDDLAYLVHYARLAANSHNTQPWRFARSDDRIIISPDLSRATPVVDPDHHHLYASLGCAAENLALAAAAAGSEARIGFLQDGRPRVEVDLAAAAPRRDLLFDAIIERQSTRSDYDGRAVPVADMKAMEEAAAVEGCRVVFITEPGRVEAITELVVKANTAQIANPDFVAELKKWLRYNGAQAINTHDGLYAGCTGNPTLPPWLGQALFGLLFSAKSDNARHVRHIGSSAGLAVFVSDRDDPAHWVAAGRSYQRFALAATLAGVRHAFINQLVEIPGTRRELATFLGLGDRRPDLVLRFGYATPMPRSLRRPLADVIV